MDSKEIEFRDTLRAELKRTGTKMVYKGSDAIKKLHNTSLKATGIKVTLDGNQTKLFNGGGMND